VRQITIRRTHTAGVEITVGDQVQTIAGLPEYGQPGRYNTDAAMLDWTPALGVTLRRRLHTALCNYGRREAGLTASESGKGWRLEAAMGKAG
jgi:hypothetical protein